jgi:hypothetical protein
VTAPPTTGPPRIARPVTPAKTPSARPRRSAGNAALSSASACGTTIAALAPCTARAAISAPTFGASAQPTDASAKAASPARNIRDRPHRSPSVTDVISSIA